MRLVGSTKRHYINFGEFVCRRVGLSASWLSANWIVGELVCRRAGLLASWSVGELAVGELVCRRVVHKPLGQNCPTLQKVPCEFSPTITSCITYGDATIKSKIAVSPYY